jgi:hypothetical protein
MHESKTHDKMSPKVTMSKIYMTINSRNSVLEETIQTKRISLKQ